MLRQTVIAAVCIAALPLAAQARPELHPTRDVVVQYHVTGPRGPNDSGEVKVYYAEHGQRMRIEPAGRPGYMIVDRSAARMDMVMPAQHIYVDLPYDPKTLMNFEDKDARFTRHGTDTVAGLRCTVYEVESRGHTGQICLTDDGVMLRAKGNDPQRQGMLEAISVQYGPQPASLFAPPPGYQKLDAAHLPQMGGAGWPQR